MPFNIIRGDITRLETDAIVNATNPMLQQCGDVCGAIFEAAGKERLQQACDKIGYCAFGDAVITKGYALKSKYIIHTASPMYGRHPILEANQLYSCYKKSLELAKTHKITSIAFPIISSGFCGFPKKQAIKIATKAIKDFLEKNEMDVYLVVYDSKAFQISEKLLCDVQNYIDEKLVKTGDRRRIAKDGVTREAYNLYAPKKTMRDECFEERMEAPQMIEMLPKATVAGSLGSKGLIKKKSLEDLMKVKVETFSEMLLRMIDEKGMTDVEVYKRANIDRKLFSKIRRKDYTPKKATVVALIVALKLNMKEARELLGRAGFAFTQSSKFDIIIQYFIEQQKYDIFEINETLFAFEQQLLGA